jgi:hypothetical protein
MAGMGWPSSLSRLAYFGQYHFLGALIALGLLATTGAVYAACACGLF